MSELEKKLGELLRLERERRKLSLEEISAQLKISEENLQSVEMGAIDKLPDRLYFTLFAKTYSETIGIDYERTIEAIRDDLGESPEPSIDDTKADNRESNVPSADDQDPGTGATRDHNSFLKPALWGFGGLIAAFVAFLLINTLVFQDTEVLTDEQDATPAILETKVDQSTHNVDGSETAEGATDGFNWDVPDYQPPEDLKLTLNVRGQSWATILADGDTALFDNLRAGRKYEVTARHRLRISIAVPSVVDISLNGQEANIADSASGRIRRVVVDQTNVASILARPMAPPVQRQSRPTSETGPNATIQEETASDTGSDATRQDETTSETEPDTTWQDTTDESQDTSRGDEGP